MKCREVMVIHVFRCRDDDTALHCATLMRAAQAGFVAVVEPGGSLVGVVTDRDLVLRVMAENRPLSTPIAEVMSRGPFVTFDPEEELAGLEQRMAQARVWRAVALDGQGRCVGLISLTDLAQHQEPARVGELLRAITGREAAHEYRL